MQGGGCRNAHVGTVMGRRKSRITEVSITLLTQQEIGKNAEGGGQIRGEKEKTGVRL